jgi:exonuclease SbcC
LQQQLQQALADAGHAMPEDVDAWLQARQQQWQHWQQQQSDSSMEQQLARLEEQHNQALPAAALATVVAATGIAGHGSTSAASRPCTALEHCLQQRAALAAALAQRQGSASNCSRICRTAASAATGCQPVATGLAAQSALPARRTLSRPA